jgi:hypothetical protein
MYYVFSLSPTSDEALGRNNSITQHAEQILGVKFLFFTTFATENLL